MNKVFEVYIYAKQIEKVLLISHHATENEAKKKAENLRSCGETEVYIKTCLMDEYSYNIAMGNY